VSLGVDNVCVDEFVLVEEQHALAVLAPGDALDVELAAVHAEGALQDDPVLPEEHLLAAAHDAQVVLLLVPLYHLHLAAQRNHRLDLERRHVPDPHCVRHVV